MKRIIILLMLSATIQSYSQFDITKYKEYLKSHMDMSYQSLLHEYPAGLFLDSLHYDFMKSEYGSTMDKYYALTLYEKQLLNRNGFLVTERRHYSSFQQAFLEIYNKDFPVFISSDAILHAFHYSFDVILKHFENSFCSKYSKYGFTTFFDDIKGRIAALKQNCTRNDGQYLQALKDLDVYFAVPTCLYLGDSLYTPVFKENQPVVNSLLSAIESLKLQEFGLFAVTPREIDFSQYKPRGHYTESEELKKYFRTMIWFGRTDLYISKPMQQDPEYLPTDGDIDRQTMLAALIAKTVNENDSGADSSSTLQFYDRVNSMIDSLMGFRDNLVVTDMIRVLDETGISDITELEDSAVMSRFQSRLLEINSSKQLYNSQLLTSDPFNPEQASPGSVFLLFGQAPTIDNFITAHVVYDEIKYQGKKIMRMKPSTLDILFAFGNDAAIQLLKKDLEQYNYSSNLAATRYLIDSYKDDFWSKSFYTLWLAAIKSLNPTLDRNTLPEFMQTAAWQQKNMNTQLASWIELRHDFILYARQSYTKSEYSCYYPYYYVEPVPDVYRNIRNAMVRAQNISKKLGFGLYTGYRSIDFFKNWDNVCTNLIEISNKELNSTALSDENNLFLSKLMDKQNGCPPYMLGWYADLFLDRTITLTFPIGQDIMNDGGGCEVLTADFHTTPTNELGEVKGYVMHGGTGPFNLAIITAKTPDGKLRSYAGAVMSYYETTTMNFKRLTDDEWDSLFSKGTFSRPQFCNLYLADEHGNSIPDKLSLLTYHNPNSIENNDAIEAGTAQTYSFPNPFDEYVNIMVKIPSTVSSGTLGIEIVDLNGAVVGSYVFNDTGSGNFMFKWDGRDSKGNRLPPGAYIYNISAGDCKVSGKVVKK